MGQDSVPIMAYIAMAYTSHGIYSYGSYCGTESTPSMMRYRKAVDDHFYMRP